jgi:hypothetical protein
MIRAEYYFPGRVIGLPLATEGTQEHLLPRQGAIVTNFGLIRIIETLRTQRFELENKQNLFLTTKTNSLN